MNRVCLSLLAVAATACAPAATTPEATAVRVVAAPRISPCDRVDRRQREALTALGAVPDVPAVFRRCQFLRGGAAGLVPVELSNTAISHQRQFTYRLVLEAETELPEPLRRAPGATATTYVGESKTTDAPLDLVARDGKSGALEDAFIAARTAESLLPFPLPGGPLAGETAEAFAPLLDRTEGAKPLRIAWQDIRWQSPTHLLTYRLPDLEIAAPIPHGGATTERLRGAAGAICLDDAFAPCRPVDLRFGLAESCRALPALPDAGPNDLWAAAQCARLRGEATEKVVAAVGARCEVLAHGELVAAPRDDKPASGAGKKGPTRPPEPVRRKPIGAPGACFAVADRLAAQAALTAGAPQPAITVDRAVGDTLGHLSPLLAP